MFFFFFFSTGYQLKPVYIVFNLKLGGIHLITCFIKKLEFWSGKIVFLRKQSKYANFQLALELERFIREKTLIMKFVGNFMRIYFK